jgi:RimJ/RimL family protein N-acetyltransferase
MESASPATSRVELRDGSAALVAPLYIADRDRYLAGFRHASAESLYRRFMSPVERLSASQLRYLLDVDHRDHEALLAVDEEGGEAVGVARFVRLAGEAYVAEPSVMVVDDWQGLGLGTALCRLLAGRATELGICRFEASVLADNRPMLAILESLGVLRVVSREGPAVAVSVTLPAADA